MKTIAIANQKGGTGKTTTTYNLGIALTQQGYRVLMVDFDPQGNLSCYCGIPPEKDLDQTIIHKANLWLDSGHIFGPSGSGFQRLNIACPRSVLEKGLRQLADAFPQ